MNPEDISVQPVAPNNDKAIARLSLNLLLLVSVFHAVWLLIRNKNDAGDFITNLFQGETSELAVFLIPFVILFVLNFLPYFLARSSYKNGRYKKQIITSIITFVLFQFILHALITITGATLC